MWAGFSTALRIQAASRVRFSFCAAACDKPTKRGLVPLRASADFNVPLLFAALMALAILGVVIYLLTVWVERRMTGWAYRSGGGMG